MTDQNVSSDWISLVTSPQAILHAYSGKPPSLSGFLLDTVVLSSNEVCLIGQFGTLPEVIPRSWIDKGKTRAFGVIRLLEIRNLTVSGLPGSGQGDDSMHGLREGLPVDLRLTTTGDVFTSRGYGSQPWCRLIGSGSGFEFSAEAVDIFVEPGLTSVRIPGSYR